MESINPEAIILNIYNSSADLLTILNILNESVKANTIEPNILIEAINKLIGLSQHENESGEQSSDYVKDKILYMKGSNLLHMKLPGEKS